MKVKIFITIFILFVALTPTLFSPDKPILSCSQEIAKLIINGDHKAAELYLKNNYNPPLGSSSTDSLLATINDLQNFGVESYKIKASTLTDATIILESKSKTRKALSLKIGSNSPYMIEKLQEIQLNF